MSERPTPFSRARVDAEELHPAGRLLETELTAAHLAQHEPDDLAGHLGHLRRVGVASQVIHDTVFPGIRAVGPGDLLIDPADALDVELGHRSDLRVCHEREYAAKGTACTRSASPPLQEGWRGEQGGRQSGR